jgi:lipopolysaccharide export system permease protein
VTIVSRYIASVYLRMLWLCIGAFLAIYLVIHFLEKIGRFAAAHGTPGSISLYFLCKIPEVIVQVTPLAVLMATLLTLGLFAKSSEITAMRSSGISLLRIVAPILGIALAASLLTFVIGEVIVPRSTERMKYIEEVQIAKKSPNTFFRQSNIWYREAFLILRAHLFDPPTCTLRGVTIWLMGPGMQPVKRIEASQAVFINGGCLLKNVTSRELVAGDVAGTTTAQEAPLPINLRVSDLKVIEKFSDDMGFFELRRYCKKLKRGGYNPVRYVAQMHSRISLPFSSLIMAFLGIPFALRGGRSSGIAVGIGTSLGIGFCYFFINAFVLSYGQTGVLPPFVAAWAANVIFAAAGVWLAMTVNR